MLYDLLTGHNNSGVTAFHMPGHMRNTALLGHALPYEIDITELEGFDNLHEMRGVLKDVAGLAASLYGAKRAFPMVNGTTGGILAAVRSAARSGDTILMARGCHRSVYNAVLINRLKPVYLLPETDGATGAFGSITPEAVENALNGNPETTLVVVTSPTYEGVTSDIAGICAIAHRRNIPVLVDAAHGAHLGFSGAFPPGAVACGADIVITSLHKTLPALTQCALALFNSDRISEGRLHQSLTIYQTSSPSYVLLSSIDACLRLLDIAGAHLFEEYAQNLASFGARVTGLQKLRVLCRGQDQLSGHPAFFGVDPGKLVVTTRGSNLGGPALKALLRSRYGLELEMAAAGYAVAMTSVCTPPDAFIKLSDALLEIDAQAEAGSGPAAAPGLALPVQALPPCEAEAQEGRPVPLEEAEGLMALEYVWAYPPGVPMLVPGEIIGGDSIRAFRDAAAAGVALHSTRGGIPSSIVCV